jgi:guanylate kinase
MIFILSGISGVGKTTIAQLMEKDHNFVRSISYTSREPRKNEVHNKDYVFITRDEFEEKIKQNFFLEYTHQFDNFYGTSYEHIEKLLNNDKKIIMCLTKEGFQVAKIKWPKLTLGIYLLPPDSCTLEKRLYKRDQCLLQKDLDQRIKQGCTLEDYEEYHHVISPDTIENTLNKILDIKKKTQTLAF